MEEIERVTNKLLAKYLRVWTIMLMSRPGQIIFSGHINFLLRNRCWPPSAVELAGSLSLATGRRLLIVSQSNRRIIGFTMYLSTEITQNFQLEPHNRTTSERDRNERNLQKSRDEPQCLREGVIEN